MKEIVRNDVVLARIIQENDWAEGLGFFSNDHEYIQVGTWRYDKGKELQKHIHNEAKRNVVRTQEVLFVKKGSIEASIYDFNENLIEVLVVKEGEVIILLDSGHGYKILENNTQVLEIKNGPYLGPDIDRRRF